jgi:predicted membrane protein
MWTMTAPRTPEVTPHVAFGVSLALLGVVLTLDNLGFVDAGAVMRFWPLVPMLVGAAYVVQGREARNWAIGAVWLAAGTAFLLRNLGIFHFRLTDFLPLILVAIGLKVIFHRRQQRAEAAWPGMPGVAAPPPPPPPPGFATAADSGADIHRRSYPAWTTGSSAQSRFGQVIRVFAVLWGAERRARGPVAHVEVSAVMGGCDVDMREAVPTREPLAIQVFAMWGGIDIQVPPGWSVENEAWPILGGIVDNTRTPALPTHRVILRGMAFMGGVEIKN